MRVDGGQSDGQNVGMFPSGSHHDGEVQGNATGSMDTLVGPVPSHDGALAVVHDAPMAYHAHPGARARVGKETVVQSARQGQPVDDLEDKPGSRVQESGRVVGVEAKRRWMVDAWDD